MDRDERRELMLLYVAGSLDADEQRPLRAQLEAGDPGALADYAEAQATLAHLPLALDESDQPAAGAKDRLFEAVDADAASSGGGRGSAAWQASQPPQSSGPDQAPFDRSIKDKRTRRSWWALAAAAVLGIAAGLTGGLVVTNQQNAQQAQRINRLQGKISQQQIRMQVMQQRVLSANRIMRTLNSAQSRRVVLKGKKPQPDAAAGVLIYDPSDQSTVFQVHGMKPPPTRQTYQLWLVNAKKQKISVGTFSVDKQGQADLTAQLQDSPGQVSLAAVTNEPEGGSPQPTGEFQMLGKFDHTGR